MTPTLLSLSLALLLTGQPADDDTETPRKPHPFAPSLPELTDEEEARFDKVVDRFILYDTGKLGGAEGKKALRAFQQLGPEATFALIRGLNRAAAIEHSCPVLVIARKLRGTFSATKDRELLQFARENIGAGVGKTKHAGVLKELKLQCTTRQAALRRSGGRPVLRGVN